MPRPGTRLIHPGLEKSLKDVGWYESTCTIMTTAEALDDIGQETETPAVLAGHENLPCRIAPVVGTVAGMEREGPETTTVMRDMTAKLPGAWPTITEKHQAEIDGRLYDIEKVDINSEKTFTLLALQVVE